MRERLGALIGRFGPAAAAALPGGAADPSTATGGWRRRWPLWLGAALTLLMLAGLARQLAAGGVADLSARLPATPLFYLSFLGFYLAPPLFDYLIFRKLWSAPPESWVALNKKRIANEVLVGYSGEAYFYAWARQRPEMVAAPFGAVKDTGILSAMAGNGLTLVGMVAALPFAARYLGADEFRILWLSALVILAISMPVLLFSRRVFSLPPRMLGWVFAMQCARILTTSALLALSWHFAMPEVVLGVWLFLVAGRLLASRLPLVPNKDLLFANFAILLIGQGAAVSSLIALTAALTLCAHALLMLGWGGIAVARRVTG